MKSGLDSLVGPFSLPHLGVSCTGLPPGFVVTGAWGSWGWRGVLQGVGATAQTPHRPCQANCFCDSRKASDRQTEGRAEAAVDAGALPWGTVGHPLVTAQCTGVVNSKTRRGKRRGP